MGQKVHSTVVSGEVEGAVWAPQLHQRIAKSLFQSVVDHRYKTAEKPLNIAGTNYFVHCRSYSSSFRGIT